MPGKRDADDVAMHEPGDELRRLLYRAFSVAGRTGELARPIHLLAALAEGDGPIALAFKLPGGERPFVLDSDQSSSRGGGGSSYLLRQIDGAAEELAYSRGEVAGSEHLLLALVDQGDVEVAVALISAGLEMTALRAIALEVLGGPVDLPPISMPSLDPAGTMDRPPLPLRA